MTDDLDDVNTVVYGLKMNSRLSKENWLDHGLKILATKGPDALKADVLAKLLKVSRGSFYWHFKDIGQFHDELLARWRKLATDEIIITVDQKLTAAERLRLLMHTALMGDEKLERGIRSWAAQNTNAARAITSVDKARVRYLQDVLKLAGLSNTDASMRATFIYWAYIGRVMVGKGSQRLNKDEISVLADVMLSDDRSNASLIC